MIRNIYLLSLCLDFVLAQVPYTAVSRWGQAVALLNDTIYVQGGKTDPSNQFGYTAAPTNNDLLSLSLSSPFDNTSVPWQLLSSDSNTSTSHGPVVAWHTISAFNTSDILVFGGEGGPNNPPPTPDGSDSAWILNVDNRVVPQFTPESTNWGSEPVRRIHHTAVTDSSGKVYIVGGQMADLSGNVFPEHYVFDPSGSSFTQLPSDNAPPAITRHGSVILSNGVILVFGGYSTNTSALVPFSTIWTLDTTRSPLSWSTLNVSSSSLPPSRRDFAYTVLPGSRLLIHGGIDGDTSDHFEVVFSDGWILDVTLPGASWIQIDSLSQLGQRFDHFAVAYDSTVIFGFGYGPFGPAPASVQIYNSSGTGSWSPSYTPPPASQTPTQSLPGQTSTIGHSTSTGLTATNPTITSGGGGGGGENEDQRKARNKATAIAIGVTLGCLALLGICAIIFILLRKRRREEAFRRSFMALGDDNEGDSPDSVVPVPARYREKNGRSDEGWTTTLRNLAPIAALGFLFPSSRARTPPARRDILADEDTRDFQLVYRRRSSREGSTWSLRSILGRRSREPSTQSTGAARWGDKDPFSDGVSLMADDEANYSGTAHSTSRRPSARRDWSYASTMSAISGRSYVDPFADPIPEETRSYHDSEPSGSSSTGYPHPNLQIQTLLPLTTEPHVLSPVTEMSRNTSSFGSPSVSSHTSSQEPRLTPFENTSGLTSATSANSRSPRPSSIMDPVPGNAPPRRSNSWWARFSRSGFLDRGSESRRPLDFRDPNPPPRLMAIEESQHSASPENDKDSPGSHRSNSLKRGLSAMVRNKRGGSHAKSTSSLGTAHSEAIAGMDVAQHERTGSNRTRDSTGTSFETRSEDPHWLPRDRDGAADDVPEEVFTSPVDMTHLGGLRDHPLSPVNALSPSQTPPGASGASSSTSLSSGGSKRPPSSTGGVSARIREYERRMSQDLEVLPPTNTKHREERGKSSHIGYGLVPRPSLYVANPDTRHPSSSVEQ